jgi:inner membrane protein
MDNITHSLVGLALAETGLKRATPLATATLIIAANFPDIDIVTGLSGSLIYLEHHRGITHALAALPVLSLLLAALVFWYSRWKDRGTQFVPLLGLSLLGMITHPLLDFLNSYGWRPFLPWDHHWFYGDTAFVIDPWLWVFFGGALFITTTKTQLQSYFWTALFVLMAAVVLSSGSVSPVIRIVWLVLVACAFWLRQRADSDERTARMVSLSLLFAMIVYFGALAWLHRMALDKTGELARVVKAYDGGRQIQTSALPIPANPLVWRAVVATEQAFYLADLDLTRPLPVPESMARYQRESGDSSLIAAARRTAEARTFLRFARFPVSEVITSGQNGLPAEVEIRDVRFQYQGVTNTFRLRIRLDKNFRPVVEQ